MARHFAPVPFVLAKRMAVIAIAAGCLSASWLTTSAQSSVLVQPRILDRESPAPSDEPAVRPESTPAELPAADRNLPELASSVPGFSTLNRAIQAANVGSVLDGEGPFTVFAPTDAAFAALPPGTLDALLLPENRDLLVQLLYNHVSYGAITSNQLSVGTIDTFDGTVSVGITPNGVMVDNANVIQADVPATNGVLHAVDQVLVPDGLGETLQARLAEDEEDTAESAASAEPERPVRGLW